MGTPIDYDSYDYFMRCVEYDTKIWFYSTYINVPHVLGDIRHHIEPLVGSERRVVLNDTESGNR